jgi:hypothetical protein
MLVLVIAALAYIKLIRSEYIKQLGPFERFIVMAIGCAIAGAVVAAICPYDDLKMDIWIAGFCGTGGLAFILAGPWLLQPINDANNERTDQVNAAMQRTDEPFASKREAILKRARTNNYASDEQLVRDVKHLAIMLGDEKAAIGVINHYLEQSLIYQDDEPVEVKPISKEGIRRK